MTAEEREYLSDPIKRRSRRSRSVQRDFMLMAADEAEGGLAWPDTRIAESYHAGLRTLERLHQRFVEEGLEVALHGKRGEPKLDITLAIFGGHGATKETTAAPWR